MSGSSVWPLGRVPARAPPVRATRSQLEVDYLPPYGDPEVDLRGEVATYVLAGGLAAGAVACLARVRPSDQR